MLALILATALAQSDQAVYEAIRKAAFEESQALAHARHLCDRIGARVTGSSAYEKATDWAVERLTGFGLEATRESWQIPRAWRRGTARARLVAPVRLEVPIAACGWSQPTRGTIRGNLRAEDGSWLVAGEVGDLARLIDSARPYRLFDMRLAEPLTPFEPARLPTAMITSADAQLFSRLLRDGAVELELELATELEALPVEVHDVVGQLEGGARSEEIVFAATHLDSWDLASGATDNAAGCAVVIEAARILAGLPSRPRRTVRFLLFAGGAQGYQGSARYVERHREEMSEHVAGLVVDGGTGALLGLALDDQRHLLELIERWFLVIKEDMAFHDVSFRSSEPADHVAFQRAGVPAFKFIQEPVDYRLTQGSQADTFDTLAELNLQQAATVLAWGLWAIADHDGDIPRAEPK